jgi:hypothetical protein
MSSDSQKDLDTLQKMIELVGDASEPQSIVDALELLIENEFPEDPYYERDDINDKICELMDPWMKAGMDDDSIPEEELPQPNSEKWRKQFLDDLVAVKSLISSL